MHVYTIHFIVFKSSSKLNMSCAILTANSNLPLFEEMFSFFATISDILVSVDKSAASRVTSVSNVATAEVKYMI